jgi:Fe-S cluster assembly protein SufD
MSAVVDFPVLPETRPYIDAFRADPTEPAWLGGERRRSLARFAEFGFPNRRGEAWRYLDLRPLAEEPLPPLAGTGPAASPPLLAEIGLPEPGWRLVLVDGRFAPRLSRLEGLPAGLRLGTTTAAIATHGKGLRAVFELGDTAVQPFAALNAAFFTDGFVLEASPGVVLDRPLEIVHLACGAVPSSLHTRSLVSLGAGSAVRLFESYAGSGRYWRNDVLAVRLGEGAVLTRAALVEEAGAAVHLGLVDAGLGARADFADFLLLLGGRTVRREIRVGSTGEGAQCRLYGGFAASGREEANIVTTVEHLAAGGTTREVFKGVAAGRSHGAFQGRITVAPGAQKTDAHMLSRNLTLGAHAAIDTKPELEIYADDVRCSHGAAVGDLDEEALFYLLARGIRRREARRMLIEAFLRDAVESLGPELLRSHLLARLGRRLRTLENGA